MAPKRKYILEGKRFGKLIVVKEVPFKTSKDRQYLCQCDCGNLKEIRLTYLLKNTISCGCALPIERHGESKTKLYGVWKSIVERCESPHKRCRHRYKDRGITICSEWRDSFLAFKKWALEHGYGPNLQIDRINNNGNYEPANCRFVTQIDNNNNRENTLMVHYGGETVALAKIVREFGLIQNYSTIRHRVAVRNWPVSKAISTPIRKCNRMEQGIELMHRKLKELR